MRILTFLACFVVCCLSGRLSAQNNVSFSPDLMTLRTSLPGGVLSPCVLNIHDQHFVLEFDFLSHEYNRFRYHIVHCNADWESSELLESEYVDGFAEGYIDNYRNSINTTVLYSHYSLSFPNDETTRLKLSGNYRIDVYAEDTDSPVACFYLMVVEPRVDVRGVVLTSTDIDTHDSHQQLDFSVNLARLNVSFPESEIITRFYKNGQLLPVYNILPSYRSADNLFYNHNRSLIFDAGNEFRRFECLSVHYPTMGIDAIKYLSPYYHVELLPDAPRNNYIFDEDHDGCFVVRTVDSSDDPDITADYVFVNFTLQSEKYLGELFVVGQFNGWNKTSSNQMHYDEIRKCYTASILMKQGYYEYAYQFAFSSNENPKLFDGNFYQTQNKYSVFVYYRQPGSRYDRLVGILSCDSK